LLVNVLDVRDLVENDKNGILKAIEICNNVDNITNNIRNYTQDTDAAMLKILKKLCMQKSMPEETAKMTRNIGMHYFYKNDTERALRYINTSIKAAIELESLGLLVTFLADKGLVLFYDLKYEQAKVCYLKAFKLLPDTIGIDKRMIHLLYYRSGLLYNFMGNYEDSYEMLYKALEYADNITDIGWVHVNIGVNFERQGLYEEALREYDTVLQLYGESYDIERSSVYNNIAQVYMDMEDYDTAIQNINKAFELLECKNLSKFFVFFQTYTEIKVLQGELKEELTKLIELLNQVKDYFVYKCYVIDGINVAVKTSSEDKAVLSKLSKEIKAIINQIGKRNEEYRQELDNFMDNICFSLNVLSSK